MSQRDPRPVDDGQTYSASVETRGGNRPADYMPGPQPLDAEEALLDDEPPGGNDPDTQ